MTMVVPNASVLSPAVEEPRLIRGSVSRRIRSTLAGVVESSVSCHKGRVDSCLCRRYRCRRRWRRRGAGRRQKGGPGSVQQTQTWPSDELEARYVM